MANPVLPLIFSCKVCNGPQTGADSGFEQCLRGSWFKKSFAVLVRLLCLILGCNQQTLKRDLEAIWPRLCEDLGTGGNANAGWVSWQRERPSERARKARRDVCGTRTRDNQSRAPFLMVSPSERAPAQRIRPIREAASERFFFRGRTPQAATSQIRAQNGKTPLTPGQPAANAATNCRCAKRPAQVKKSGRSRRRKSDARLQGRPAGHRKKATGAGPHTEIPLQSAQPPACSRRRGSVAQWLAPIRGGGCR